MFIGVEKRNGKNFGKYENHTATYFWYFMDNIYSLL